VSGRAPNPSIERTDHSQLLCLWSAPHVEHWGVHERLLWSTARDCFGSLCDVG
jgi:hypothetical protein